jgi:DNA polymerase-1
MPESFAYRSIDLPLVYPLIGMEDSGCLIDEEFTKVLYNNYNKQKEEASAKFYSLIGSTINLDSSKQVAEALEQFDFAKHLPRTGKKKQLSTNQDDLLPYISHPCIAALSAYRGAAKQLSTYIEPFLAAPQGRIHTVFGVTNTGRLSSGGKDIEGAMNLQNITTGDLRKAICAPEGMLLLKADYSQLELRILAAESGDKTMEEVFRNNGDIHRTTAIEVFGDATKRDAGKTLNFAISYGATAATVAERTGQDHGAAEAILQRYFDRFRGVREYILHVRAKAAVDGFVESRWGRRRYIPEMYSTGRTRADGNKRAVNTLIQGGAADCVKLKMVELSKQLPSWARMILQVHDELLFEVEAAKAGQLAKLCNEVLTFDGQLPVQLKLGKNWKEMNEIKWK